MELNKDNKPSPKMDEFLDKVDKLCHEYGYEFWPTLEGWTGKINEDGEYPTFVCMNDKEAVKLICLDGDGRGN
jgi:hypothetical protein